MKENNYYCFNSIFSILTEFSDVQSPFLKRNVRGGELSPPHAIYDGNTYNCVTLNRSNLN